ncbi:MAG: 50S ribosomal protein L29 [Gammaproteobacteria bacterium TMED119]|nr:MAG: 50S ribosomal protein L29 [Gammaproteobacteria bacterium TMED119]RCL45997.1 MAG: 50S ribosomal protein L29 [Candidatus Thioglobus sp.]|tara:strand:+ start:5085 stop:5276 length:192 start_codon:yes stop_codon:yes gene_type:complete
MSATELRAKDEQSLKAELIELRKQQFKLRMQYSMGQSTRNHEFSRIRKDIARIKTVLNEMSRA